MRIPLASFTANGLLPATLLVAWLLVLSAYSVYRPAYNFDTIPYMDVILLHEGMQLEDAQAAVKQKSAAELTPAAFALLYDTTDAYRRAMFNDSRILRENLPMYIVKPLYSWFSVLLHRAGVSLSRATVIPSATAYFILCLLFYGWTCTCCGAWRAFAITLLVSLWSPMLQTAALSTPDLLCGLFVILAIHALRHRQSDGIFYTWLALAIFSRIDAVLPALFLACMKNSRRFNSHPRKFSFFVGLLALLFSALCVSASAHRYGWAWSFYGDFVSRMNIEISSQEPSLHGYFTLVKSQLMSGVFFTGLTWFLLLVLLIVLRRDHSIDGTYSNGQLLVCAFVLLMIIRFILQPVVADRFYVAYYFTAVLIAVEEFVPRPQKA